MPQGMFDPVSELIPTFGDVCKGVARGVADAVFPAFVSRVLAGFGFPGGGGT
jgi:hypothetical protein